MNSDKRRRARVQGAWANNVPTSAKPRLGGQRPASSSEKSNYNATSSQSKSDGNSENHDCAVDGQSGPLTARSDRDRPQVPRVPNWMSKNVDQPVFKQKFVFEDPEEEIKMVPKVLEITKPGVFDISTEPSGVSRLRYFPQFVDPHRSEAIFAELFHEIPWKQRHDIHSGNKAMQPRLTAWYGDQPYTYAGVTVAPNTSEWPPALKCLRDQLAEVTGVVFNSLAANLYRDNHDSIGWHSDDEPIMGEKPIIASLSFGEERVFELRKKPPPNELGVRDYTYSQVYKVSLKSGSLLIMEGWTQTDWQHRVAKEYHDRGARINVTFRIVRPMNEWGN